MDKVLILRSCNDRRQGRNGFQYPESGPVACPDWDPAPHCGHGLHGFLWGQGSANLADWGVSAIWLVIEANAADVVHIGTEKVKIPVGVVVFCGSRLDACQYVADRAPPGFAVMGAARTAGYGGTATAGEGGTATAGDAGTATAGEGGTATAGYGGTATAGYRGTATAGYGGTATAGYRGTATAGDAGTATAGEGGTATAGYGGVILIRHYQNGRYRWAVGQIGENGLLPNTPYTLRDGIFVAK